MINKTLFSFSCLMLPVLVSAETQYSLRGYLSARASYYTADAEENNGQRHRAQLEQALRFSDDLSLVNQVRWKYSSLYTDLGPPQITDKKDTHEIYLGENFLKYKASSWVLQTGYQEVAWGEAFGFHYADIINPKDLRETFYSDYSESNLPLFLANYKYFFSSGSLQLIYSPEPRFSQNLPTSLFTQNILPQTTITTVKEETPDFFKEHEWGGKIAATYWELDTSLFYYDYLDRDPVYRLLSAGVSSIVLKEEHSRIKTGGLSLAKTLFDNFVIRSDVVYTQNKKINSLVNSSLVQTPVDMTNVLLSLDTPTYNNLSAVFIYARSELNEKIPNAFREKVQDYSIVKLAYDFSEEKVLELSYTHEFKQQGHSVQSLFTWPVNSTFDLRIGAESYWGEQQGQLYKIKNVSNVFLGIKNYFQL